MKPRGFQIVIWIIALGLPFIVLCIPGCDIINLSSRVRRAPGLPFIPKPPKIPNPITPIIPDFPDPPKPKPNPEPKPTPVASKPSQDPETRPEATPGAELGTPNSNDRPESKQTQNLEATAASIPAATSRVPASPVQSGAAVPRVVAFPSFVVVVWTLHYLC